MMWWTISLLWRRNPGSSVAALCDALLIYSLHGRVYTYTHTIGRQS